MDIEKIFMLLQNTFYEQKYVVLIIVLIVIVLIVAIFVSTAVFEYISKKRRKVVLGTSALLKNLTELNSQIEFDQDVCQEYEIEIHFQSKAKYDRYELKKLFDESILEDNELLSISESIKRNRCLNKDYLRQLDNLQRNRGLEIAQIEAKVLGVPYRKYIEIEKELFQDLRLKPILDSSVVCVASYTTPKGRNRYSKRHTYDIDLVPKRYAELQQKIAYQNSEEMRRKRARSQMTDKLRYSILKRDGFRCKICGRTAEDGVKLHVDHIIPVSKGGETVPGNLRTLCDACNLGKSDEIE